MEAIMTHNNSLQPLLRIKDIRRRFMLGETAIDALHNVFLEFRQESFWRCGGHRAAKNQR
jgi:hypothetical protein